MKKYVLIIIIILLITGCRNASSIEFKMEYESLNNNSNYTNVSLASDNPFLYITDELLVEKIENEEDLVVLFGYSKSNDTRDIIENIVKVSKELKIDKIYYLDILDIRDLIEEEDGNIVIKEEGSASYYKLLELLDDYLDDYIVAGEVVEKRIYSGSILVVKDKEIKGFKKIKSNLENTSEKDQEIYKMISELLSL